MSKTCKLCTSECLLFALSTLARFVGVFACCLSPILSRCDLSHIQRSYPPKILSTSRNKTHYQQIAESHISLVFYPASRTPASLIIARFIQIKLEGIVIVPSSFLRILPQIHQMELTLSHGQKNMPCNVMYFYILYSRVISSNHFD